MLIAVMQFPSQPQLCCSQGVRRQQSLCAKLLASRAAPHLTTHLLFFGWYPQKEMFFSWKKWLHLFTWGERNELSKLPSLLPCGAAGLWTWKYVLGLSSEMN